MSRSVASASSSARHSYAVAARSAVASRALDSAATTTTQAALRYWPSDLLYAFTLQMAAHGQCVSASMMLGDRDYALAQLNHAHALGDETLRALAVRLFAYFDAPVRPAALLN